MSDKTLRKRWASLLLDLDVANRSVYRVLAMFYTAKTIDPQSRRRCLNIFSQTSLDLCAQIAMFSVVYINVRAFDSRPDRYSYRNETKCSAYTSQSGCPLGSLHTLAIVRGKKNPLIMSREFVLWERQEEEVSHRSWNSSSRCESPCKRVMFLSFFLSFCEFTSLYIGWQSR